MDWKAFEGEVRAHAALGTRKAETALVWAYEDGVVFAVEGREDLFVASGDLPPCETLSESVMAHLRALSEGAHKAKDWPYLVGVRGDIPWPYGGEWRTEGVRMVTHHADLDQGNPFPEDQPIPAWIIRPDGTRIGWDSKFKEGWDKWRTHFTCPAQDRWQDHQEWEAFAEAQRAACRAALGTKFPIPQDSGPAHGFGWGEKHW